jgi:glycosyltransferase involved in cell wall biosynthesis
MKSPFSLVIICKNEAHNIVRILAIAHRISKDVVVVDSGSTDGTQSIVSSSGAVLLETNWEGYGNNKNKGVAIAKNDWILSLDADEVPDETLLNAMENISLDEVNVVYNIKRRAFIGDTMIRYGDWGNDSCIRIYNRNHARWNLAEVHETLTFPGNTKTITLKGYLHHFTSKNIDDFALKTVKYASLSASEYHQRGKKSGWVKRYLSAPFSFIKNYLFRLGFLDGEAGYTVAKMNAFYTWLKYSRLKELNNQSKKSS